MIDLDRNCFVLNNKEGIRFKLEYPVYVIKLYRAFINIPTDHLISDNQGKLRDLSLEICSLNSVTNDRKVDKISLFSPGLVTSTSALININRPFPIDNVGIGRDLNTRYDQITFSLNFENEIPDSFELTVEFDSRPGGYNLLENYQVDRVSSENEKV